MAAAALAQPYPVHVEMKRTRALARGVELAKAFDSQRPVLQDIGEYMAPYRGRFQSETQAQRGKRKGLKIINNTAGRSFNILSSGMMAGLTSPGRPWFKLTTPDPDLAEFTPHRRWLDDVARSMRSAFARSNLYNILPSVYGELAPFGTTALLQADDAEQTFRFYPFTLGTFGIAQDDRLVVDTFSRTYRCTIRQLVGRFGTDKLSQTALEAWRNGKLENEVEVLHLIEPNLDQNRNGFGHIAMPFLEEYWEKASDKTEPLMRAGYHERALFAPRWDVSGDDLWGTGLGHHVLGDVKQLQFLERRKEEVLDKHTNPPLEAGAELRGKRISLLSGDVNYTNPATTGGSGIRPIVQTDPNAYRFASDDIQVLERRIRAALFEDLFLMLSNDTRSGITAREVEERHQEKLLVLGPVLERLNEELFDPLIDRSFGIMQRKSEPLWRGVLGGTPLIPPPPKDMEGQELRVEYTSILAQASKAVNTRGIEAFGMFAGQMSQVFGPDMLDKIDADQMLDEYADAQGVPARVMRDEDGVAQIRADRAKQAQVQQAAAMAAPMKDAAAAMQMASESVPQPGSVAENMGQAGLASPLGGP